MSESTEYTDLNFLESKVFFYSFSLNIHKNFLAVLRNYYFLEIYISWCPSCWTLTAHSQSAHWIFKLFENCLFPYIPLCHGLWVGRTRRHQKESWLKSSSLLWRNSTCLTCEGTSPWASCTQHCDLFEVVGHPLGQHIGWQVQPFLIPLGRVWKVAGFEIHLIAVALGARNHCSCLCVSSWAQAVLA